MLTHPFSCKHSIDIYYSADLFYIINIFQFTHRRHPTICTQRWDMAILCEFRVWSMFYIGYCCAMYITYKIMHELLWITNFWSRVRWFANGFHEWRSHEWKSLANHIMSDQKIFHGNKCIILFLTHYFYVLNPQFHKKTIINLHFAIVTKNGLFWLLTTVDLWRHTN